MTYQEIDIERLRAFFNEAVSTLERRNAKIDRLESALHRIESWSRAYPLQVFPEPDFKKAAELLKTGGITLDAVSASNMRHVVEGVGKIARDALNDNEQLPACEHDWAQVNPNVIDGQRCMRCGAWK